MLLDEDQDNDSLAEDCIERMPEVMLSSELSPYNNILEDQQTSSLSNQKEEKILPGSSQPQDLGSISYKDMTDNSENQKTQAIDKNIN